MLLNYAILLIILEFVILNNDRPRAGQYGIMNGHKIKTVYKLSDSIQIGFQEWNESEIFQIAIQLRA